MMFHTSIWITNVYVFGLDDHKYIPKGTVEGLNIDELFDKYNAHVVLETG